MRIQLEADDSLKEKENKNMKKLTEIIAELNDNEQYLRTLEDEIEAECIEEGYPSRGANFDLRMESRGHWVSQHIEDLVETAEEIYGDVLRYDNGEWFVKENTK